jgi:hypothetical protein
VIAGFVAAVACMLIAEQINHRLYAIPNIDYKDQVAVKKLVSSLPSGAFVLVLAGWFVGTLVGTFLAAKIGRSRVPAYVVAVLLLLGGVMNAMMLPQPLWFNALAFLIFVGVPFAGIALAKPIQSASA